MNNYKMFQNKECEYFPCHKAIEEDEFNCLFCFCPLYALGESCGGNFSYTDKGIKNCMGCRIVHMGEAAHDHVMTYMEQVMELARKRD